MPTSTGPEFGKYSQNMVRVMPRTTPAQTPTDVYVVPNPYRESAARDLAETDFEPTGRRIKFFNLPRRAAIRMFTLAGDRVATLEHDDDRGIAGGEPGQAEWNLVSKDNQDTVGGIYLYHVTSGAAPHPRGSRLHRGVASDYGRSRPSASPGVGPMSTFRSAAAVLLAAATVLEPCVAAAELAFVAQWGDSGVGTMQFRYPTGIALSPSSGDVYVSDGGNNRVSRFTSDGAFLEYVATVGTLPGQVRAPDHLAFSPTNGDLYVTDKNNHRVQRLTPGGDFVLQWGSFGPGPGQFAAPWGVHIDQAGDVYVTSRDQERVQKFTESGVYLGEWGFLGTGPGQFRKPHSVLTDAQGNLYVSDVERHDIQKFDAGWDYVLQWGSPGSAVGQFLHPHHLSAVHGSIVVVDWLEHPHGGRLTAFTDVGEVTGVIVAGPQGTGELQFHTIYAAAEDGQGTWYVIEWGNHRVQKMRSTAVDVAEPRRGSWGSMKAGFRKRK